MQLSISRLTLLWALSLLLLVGCQVIKPPNFPTAPTATTVIVEASQSATPVPIAEPTLAPAAPDLAQLREATYPLESAQTGSVTLVDGEYREPSAVVAAAETVVIFMQATPGDLNQDGVPDAVVILNVNTGGTGRFYYLYAAIAQGDHFAISAPVYLGDRVVINLLQIDQAEIHLDMVVSGPNDPMCCPNTPASATYAYQDGQLVTVNKQP